MNIRTAVTWTSLALGTLCFATPARAAVCDLTLSGSSTCTLATDTASGGEVYYTTANPQPTGTGYIDPFLRLQHNTNESGYNTSADYIPATNPQDFQFDQKNPSKELDPALTDDFLGYTHDLLLSSVPIVKIGGVDYREFWLDINEPNGVKSLLSLDDLQIFLSPTGGLGVQGVSDYNTSTRKLAGLQAIYDLDAGSDNYVKLDYDLGHGSGSGDMTVFIPNSLFVGGQYVYLYSRFGLQACCNSADGFEEWWVRANGGGGSGQQSAVPEPASLFLVGTGFVVAGNRLRKRRALKNQKN